MFIEKHGTRKGPPSFATHFHWDLMDSMIPKEGKTILWHHGEAFSLCTQTQYSHKVPRPSDPI